MADPSPADRQRARQLRVMKRRATALLLAAAAIFAVTRALEDRHSWLGYVRATAEAAMVGGLADWFAVTALFRHPLGIPIPHTAIVRTRKDQLGRSLGQFVQDNFLENEVISGKLRGAQIAARLGRWLDDDANAAEVSRFVTTTLVGAVDILDDAEISQSIAQAVTERLARVDAAPLAARAIEIATADGRHHELLDGFARSARRFLDEHRDELRQRFGRESPWWVPEAVDDRIFARLLGGFERLLQELIDDPAHEIRRYLDRRLAELPERLRTDAALIAQTEAIKHDLLDHPAVRNWLASLWGDLERSLVAQAGDPASGLRVRLAEIARSIGRSLAGDPALRARVDERIERAIKLVVQANRHEVADLIESTVAKWDADEASQRIELQVGRDLQFIRINGTLVGGLAGLAIYSIGQLLG